MLPQVEGRQNEATPEMSLGGPGRTRTGDPRDANAMLSQLSYRPRATA